MTKMLNEIAFFIFILTFILSIGIMYYSLGQEKARKGLRRSILKSWVINNLNYQSMNAIQAIRNMIIVNNAFISALLIFTGLLIGLYSRIFTKTDRFLWTPGLTVNIGQLVLVGFCIVFCLLCFINSNRMSTNLSFLISSNPRGEERNKEGKKEEVQTEEEIILIRDTFRIAQHSWMLGIRGVFFLLAAITWLLHPIALLCSSLAITLYVILVHDFAVFKKQLPKD